MELGRRSADLTEPLAELVSADPSAAGVDPGSARPLIGAGVSPAFGRGSRVNRAAVVGPNVKARCQVSAKTDMRSQTEVPVRRQERKYKTGNQG